MKLFNANILLTILYLFTMGFLTHFWDRYTPTCVNN